MENFEIVNKHIPLPRENIFYHLLFIFFLSISVSKSYRRNCQEGGGAGGRELLVQGTVTAQGQRGLPTHSGPFWDLDKGVHTLPGMGGARRPSSWHRRLQTLLSPIEQIQDTSRVPDSAEKQTRIRGSEEEPLPGTWMWVQPGQARPPLDAGARLLPQEATPTPQMGSDTYMCTCMCARVPSHVVQGKKQMERLPSPAPTAFEGTVSAECGCLSEERGPQQLRDPGGQQRPGACRAVCGTTVRWSPRTD
ncbi:uncharacterized protein LOC120599760 [Pteropus medius]|uniref:uncharacterized protein LOC120599760 n=1 Tax=Pteropus vampyrus TaxID=132908 RepID=UPI00196B97D4|nr:uncharacterized protein LOC120599760 [Pteropus giganteus]